MIIKIWQHKLCYVICLLAISLSNKRHFQVEKFVQIKQIARKHTFRARMSRVELAMRSCSSYSRQQVERLIWIFSSTNAPWLQASSYIYVKQRRQHHNSNPCVVYQIGSNRGGSRCDFILCNSHFWPVTVWKFKSMLNVRWIELSWVKYLSSTCLNRIKGMHGVDFFSLIATLARSEYGLSNW